MTRWSYERYDPATGETSQVPPPFQPDPDLLSGSAREHARIADQNRTLDALTEDDKSWLYGNGWDGRVP